ncbi:unnamed protein product [Paramecium sonneborni]|uniref:Transmembrane protein n=1 Tax=Paramecium sonneborni TaxID=65129 RepID=A0A8S1R361_9CILI|nr:unnamed protein product [Paramecium sonneborni]
MASNNNIENHQISYLLNLFYIYIYVKELQINQYCYEQHTQLITFDFLKQRFYQAKVIKSLDIFGQSITLNINKQKTYKTVFGGISSICLIFILITIFQSNIVDFFQKSDVSFATKTEFDPKPDQIVMNIKNYMVAFSIEQENFVNQPMFNITIEQRHYYRNQLGNLVKQVDYLQLEPCTLEHFQFLINQTDSDFESQFNQLELSKWLCPQKNFEFYMEGTYTSTEFDFIRVIVSDCDDTKSGYLNWKPTCATKSQKDQHLNKEGQFKLQIYQVNSVVNPKASEQYYQSYLDGEMYFTFVPQKLSRQANLFYRKYQFENDNSLMPFFKDIHEKELIVRQSVDYRDLTELGRDTDKNYAIVYLRRSQFSEFIYRRFMKIDELLSFLGGFLQIMITGFGIFIMYYNKLSLQIELSNKLYKFSKRSSKAATLKKSVKQTANQSILNESQIEIKGDQQSKKDTNKKYGMNITHSILNLFEKSSKLKLTPKSLINYLSFGYLLNDNDTKIFKKAMVRVDQSLDIQEILYQLQEINKLKELMLKKQQIILFNFTQKPNLTLEDEDQLPSRLQIEQELNEENKEEIKKELIIKDLYNAWFDIRFDQTQNLCQQELNQKLNQELGNDIESVFSDYVKIQQNQKNQKESSQIINNLDQHELIQSKID